MADPKKKEKDLDPRIDFFQSYCLTTMRLKVEKWTKMLSYDENRDLIMEFLVNPLQERLIISVSPAGVVLPMNNFPPSAKGKISYFVRKNLPSVLTLENMHQEIMFGDVSPRPIDDLSILVDFLFFPILMNASNQDGWPEVMIKDVVSQIQILRNVIAEVRGNINNQTILPMPMTIDRVMNTSVAIAAGRLDMCDGEMKNSLEAIVLKWSDQIDVVLKEDVSSLFKNEPHPLPIALFSYWTSRLSNLENIFDQLRNPQARTIGFVLEKIDSVYYSAFRTTFNNIVLALHMARDLTLYFLPLQKQIEQFDSTDFDDTKEMVRPLLHVICLVWSHSQYCCTNDNMVLLFTLINNMLIANASKTLDPGSLFQGEVDEGLLKINTTIDIFLHYKEQFFEYQKELPNYILPDTNPILWSFKPKTIFRRFDAFVNRLQEIKEIFVTANEFVKLEKVEIGGLRGRAITRELTEIFDSFQTLYRHWTNIVFDPLDPDPSLHDFEKEKKTFEDKADVLERKLAYQFKLAFEDCYQVDQTTKLIEMLGSLMHRPIIFDACGNHFNDVVELFGQELDTAKFEFDEGIEKMEELGLRGVPIPTGMPVVCGALTWIFQLKDNLMRSYDEFVYLEYPAFETEEGVYQMERYDTMIDLLVKFETAIFDEWNNRLPDQINENMAKKLLIRGEDGLLYMNFDDELKIALKNIKYIKLMNFEPINEVGLAFYEREEELWDATMKLSRVVEWYNYVHDKTEKSEHDLVENEIQGLDFSLEDAITKTDWNDFNQDYIDDIYHQIEDLHKRIVRAQDNVKAIRESFRKWGNVPLYVRKDNNNQALLNIEDRNTTLANRIEECNVTKALIDEILDENFRLFHRIPLKKKKIEASEENDADEYEYDEGEEEEEGNEETNDGKPMAKSQQVNMETEENGEEGEDEEYMHEIVKTASQTQLFRAYEEYIDGVVATELMQAITNSMRYIMMEMENRTEHNAPVFEVKMELQVPHVVYIPDLQDSHTGLLSVVEEIIMLICYMSDIFPRVAQPHQEKTNAEGEVIKETYESILSNDSGIDSLRRDIINNVKNTCRSALEYLKVYRQFTFLWTVDRNEYLRQFLKYGRPLSPDELEVLQTEGTLPLKDVYPSLKSFQNEIDRYSTYYETVSNMETIHVFRVWLRVDLKGFKYGILNEISRWTSLFKQYLVNHVINSLQDLEDFCVKATDILQMEVHKEDLEKLLQVLSILNQVEERKNYTDDMFEPLKETVTVLKEYNVEMPKNTMQQFKDLPATWNLVKKLALNAKQTIGPIQAYQVDLIDKQIKLFTTRIKLYRNKFESLPIFHIPCDNIYLALDKVNRELNDMEKEYKNLTDSASLFELQPPDIGKLIKTRTQLKLLKQLWDFVFVIESCIEDWKKTPWKKIDVEVMDQECKKFGKELRSLDKDARDWEPYVHSEAMLKNLMTSLRAVTELQNPAIRDRHWQELMQATHVRFKMDDSTTLADLLALQLHKYEDEVKNIVDKSVKEMGMEKVLKDLSATWKTMEFEYEKHNRTNLKVLKASEELVEILEENQVQLQNLLSSKFIGHFLEEVSDWQTKLSNADQVINMWFEVQRKWMYLESIFIGSEDIRSQLPEDSKRFDQIDKDFKVLLQGMAAEPNVIRATNKPGLYDKLETLFDSLVLCEKALNDYLETKRLAFPRFYFVSSADLLDILSNGNQPELVARHLTKLYDSLAKLTIEPGKKTAGGMISKENEELVQFKKPCDCSGKVETWLNRVTDTMRYTLHNIFDAANRAYENKPRDQWIFDWPAQPALCTTQIWWTVEVNIAFGKLEEGYENALKDYQKKQIALLNALIVLLLGELSQGDRQKIMTICTIDVHSRDVVAKMILQKVETGTAFQWQSQLRHRWDFKLKDCFANICDAQFKYDYEYLGNTPRLVITPLTDRCYITLTQSLHLIMGGAPAGPAGTGKTETTKDLGRALGIMVYVFNCSEQMDYKSCGNIYKGLAQTGAWGCFDEFNRISVEVLSVVAVQVKTIQDAIKAKKVHFNFMGEPIVLVPTVGMFITMNPGYAGRTELPENLKALFRPCAMVVPDFALISEIMLVAEGFQEARLLSRKFITLYTLCKELLSKQDHYDWGLRAIKSVLVVAGSLKRGDRLRPEDQVLMRALRDFNIPKIVTDDVPVFMGLIGDLFPALDIPRKRILEFEELIKVSSVDLHLQPEEGFVLKVVQLEELFAVRHSVFIIGNAGTGKTQVWKTLNRTYFNQKRKPMYNDLNPKAVTNDELFGIINPSTREWKDGLFSVIMRDQANLSGNGPKWIVLDGDIDPMWIESLNTLMDDNKVLTLASNERIALTKEMRLLFEISNLRTATPATVSRAGILYINPQDLGWNPFVASWIDTRESAAEKASLNVLFDKYIPPLLEASKTKFKKITPISEIAMIQMTCHLLDCLLTPKNVPLDCPKEWYEIYFVFAILWGFGSTIFQDQLVDWRNEFNKWWLNEFKAVRFPSNQGTIFNFYIDPQTKKFLPWTELVTSFELDTDIPLQSTLVSTAETTRLRYFMDILIENKHPVMLIGGAGSGKSVIVAEKLQSLSEKYAITNVPFNFYTTSEMLQKILEKPLEKKAGRNFGPPGAKTMIYFVDDMNMPEVDTYGTVQPHTLIRQFMDYQHWYDRTKLILKDIHNCQFIACMNPTAGSFTINPRLQRHYCAFAVSFPGPEALYHIYYSILSQHVENPINKFPSSIIKVVDPLIKTAITLHQKIGAMFLPTAIKFHYSFTMRDLANIFQGMLFGNFETAPNPDAFIRSWVHEVYRVYGDKLVDTEDINSFSKLVKDIVKKGFEEFDESKVFYYPLIYSHFAESLVDPKYLPVKDWPTLSKLLTEAQVNYNDMIGAMNLVLFEDAMSHICRISRILESPRGYALLIGVGGSGKQSLTRVASFISNLDVSQVQLRKGYGVADLKADLALLYMKTGVKNVASCFLMTDSQVAEEIFLVLINDMLASGEIPELFADDEIDNIVGSVRNEVKQQGIVDSKENCWKYFIDKVRRMLKVVLCFSPVGSTLRVRSRKFPAIVNCTSIDWFHEWPKNALESVSERFLEEIDELPKELTDSISRFMAYVHETVNAMSQVYLQNEKRYNYTTPKSFLELIALYSKLLREKNKDLKDKIVRLENGLLKLVECSAQVDGLQDILKDQEVVLKVKNDAADKLIVVVGAENEKVQKEKNFANEEEKKVRIIEEDVGAKAKLCEEDLRKAEPALVAAQAALNTLNKNNLTELKSFGSPPEAVVNVCAAVMVLFSKKGKIPKDRSWKACKVMMGKVDQFLNDLVNYDKEHIHPDVIKALLPYLEDPQFDPVTIASKSGAAAGLCSWVINIHKFYEVFLIVEPKQRALKNAQTELKNAQDKLEFLNDKIQELEQKLSVIQAEFDAAMGEKAKCQAEADKTAFTIDLAHRLVNGLASENVRWHENVISFEQQCVTLPGDVLIVSCFISYVGCFTRSYRLDLLHKMWIPTFQQMKPAIPESSGKDPLEMLCDDAQIAVWNNEGLPSDRMSSENATILTNSSRWPLMIDPQLQGIKWIKEKYGDSLVVIRITMRSYLDMVEKAVTNGQVLLIENIGETIDAVLDPLLGRALIKKGKCLKMGDAEIDYNPSFRLILQTKLANPHYKPEIQAQTTLINFTVTRDGLEEQLLAEVVKAERPDLEQLKKNLTMQQNNFKITLKILEDDLLQRLSSAGDNVLEDPTLVLNLEKTKKTAAEVEIKVKEAKITSVQIDEAREHYRTSAERASILYFILNDLCKINPIYQFSLKAFTTVFNNAISRTEPADTLDARVINLIDSITFSVFMYTSRGLFECDKLIFMAQTAIQILLFAKKINPEELDFLLRFPYTPNLLSPFDFLTNNGWGGIKALSSMDEFRHLDKDIEGSFKRWKKFVDSECPEKEKFPGEWKNKTALQRLCIMRALRPDRMTYALSAFVEEELGKKYVEARTVEFAKSFEETSASTPVFFILSPGVDPLKDVEKLGKKLKFSTENGNFHNVSLGQGQEVVAEEAIDIASKDGHWVILQNIHLVAKWLSTLEKKMEATMEGANENYRLFVSAEPAASAEYHIIPQGILESAIKITNEPPTGMCANVHKALDNFNQETLEMCSKEAEFKAILFSLCYFHAVVAERRKFGPQGWNRVYPFNVGDLTISVYVLYNYLEANSKVPWEDLRYLFGEIMYGGHITDDWDRRLCRTYLEEFMQPELVDGDLYLANGFLAPPNSDYVGYHKYIDDYMPAESPTLYGLHTNAEIGFLTTLSEKTFKTIFELQPRDAGASSGAVVSREETCKSMVEDIMDKLPEEFNMLEIMARVEERTPFIIVAFQECERMNTLVSELKRSLKELHLGLKGELTITQDMEKLEEELFFDIVPESWTKRAYPSLLNLQSWFADLLIRLKELEQWAADFNLPSSVWLAGFFNPQSFLTAIMQQTARKNEWPLDKMCLNCDVTKKQKEDFSSPPREGAYVNGLYMEGARWDTKIGSIGESLLKELFPPMPVIYIKAVTQDKQDVKNIYECPVYKIRMRGPTFVWTFNLKTKERAAKWTLAGVCLLLQV